MDCDAKVHAVDDLIRKAVCLGSISIKTSTTRNDDDIDIDIIIIIIIIIEAIEEQQDTAR